MRLRVGRALRSVRGRATARARTLTRPSATLSPLPGRGLNHAAVRGAFAVQVAPGRDGSGSDPHPAGHPLPLPGETCAAAWGGAVCG